MGLFSTKKKIYVSSTVYNMAGPEEERANYLKTVVLGSVLRGNRSLGQDITHAYLYGPRLRMKRFMRWCRTSGYQDVVGQTTSTLRGGNSLHLPTLVGELEVSPGTVAEIQSARIGFADYEYWTDRYIIEHYPERLNTDYESDYNDDTNQITITWEDTSTTVFTPEDFDTGNEYLYASYVEYKEDDIGEIETGDTITLDPLEEFPDTEDWLEVSYTEDEETGESHGVWERTTLMGLHPTRNCTYSIKETMYQDVVPGTPDPIRTYRIDTQELYQNVRSPLKLFIYGYGTGNPVLDAMFEPGEGGGQFLPFIPFRIHNGWVSNQFLPDVYEASKVAYKKATGSRYDDLMDELKDNPNIHEIDYAYTVFGVSLNTHEKSAREYIYRFFQSILGRFSGNSYADWEDKWNAAAASNQAWYEWAMAQADEGNPLFGTPAPERLPYPAPPEQSIKIYTLKDNMNYNILMNWQSLEEETGFGILDPDHKVGDVWFEKGSEMSHTEMVWQLQQDGTWQQVPGQVYDSSSVFFCWQDTPSTWRRIRARGLYHYNIIYKGKAVAIPAQTALDDSEESGFIVPLHEGIYSEMSMIRGTQMVTASTYMVFNSYKVVKKRWYQRGIFKVVLIIAIIIITIYYPPAGLAGAAMMTGTAVGLAGTAALVVGAIINAMVAMIISELISRGAVALFGEKVGAIVAAIASLVVMNIGSAIMQGQTVASSFANMANAENIIKLTMAVGEGYAGYLQAAAAQAAQKSADIMEVYKEKSKEIEEAYEKYIGFDRAWLDPLALREHQMALAEPLDAFLARTLMTGSDIADLSISMLADFAELTLSTHLAV